MKYSKDVIKEFEQLSFHVNNHQDAPRPLNWQKLTTYENKKTGFYAESFVNKDGQKVLVYAGTNPFSRSDDWNDLEMLRKKTPQQAEDAYKAYEDMKNRYGNESVMIAGYSLGGSLTQIVCNETGAEGITFAAYGVGNIVKAKNTSQILNFGNENDPIYKRNFQNQLGKNYIIPDEESSLNSGLSISKHMPNQIGDVTKAKEPSTLYLQAIHNAYNFG